MSQPLEDGVDVVAKVASLSAVADVQRACATLVASWECVVSQPWSHVCQVMCERSLYHCFVAMGVGMWKRGGPYSAAVSATLLQRCRRLPPAVPAQPTRCC